MVLGLQLHARILTSLRVGGAALWLGFLAGPVRAATDPPEVDLFQARVKAYLDLHHQVRKTVPALHKKTDAVAISAHEEAFAAEIQRRRAGARAGDVFVAPFRERLLALFAKELQAPGGAALRGEILGANPKSETPEVPVTVGVNALYPSAASLSTVPAQLLRLLPVLPPELDYRFVGRDLVLRDTVANLIVDYVKNAIP